MNDLFLLTSNITVSLIGFVLWTFILLSGTLNKRTARCVITTCLGGLVWFGFLYLTLLHLHIPSYTELITKLIILLITSKWVDNTFKNKY